jgi:hypothetical protein
VRPNDELDALDDMQDHDIPPRSSPPPTIPRHIAGG